MLWTGSSVETAQIPQLSQQNRKKSWKVLSQYISELSLFKFSQSLSNSWLVMCCFSIFFSLEVHVFSVCYQVLPSDDYKCCKSQKREKLLSSCFFFYHDFFVYALPVLSWVPWFAERNQVLTVLCFSQSALHQKVATLCAAFFTDWLLELDTRTDAQPVR